MRIKSYEVSKSAVTACEDRMRQSFFKAADITNVAIANGIPESINQEYVAHRVADRLIQKHRKLGNIKMIKVDGKFLWEATTFFLSKKV
jgi:hypothetical protein